MMRTDRAAALSGLGLSIEDAAALPAERVAELVGSSMAGLDTAEA